jgi:hypothetical protein
VRTPARLPPVRLAAPPVKLRERWDRLELVRWVGAQMRTLLLKHGCEVWPACQDLYWRGWIQRYGDEEARMFLAGFDEALAERVAKIEAKANTESAL